MNRPTWGALGRDRLVWVFVLTLAIAILGFVDLALEIGQPFGGYISYRRSAVDYGTVDANTPIWWPGLIEKRLMHGDTLLAADGLPYYPHAREVFRQAAAAGRDRVTITHTRPGHASPLTSDVPVLPFTRTLFLEARLPDIIMFLVFWLLALVVYASEPGNPTNRSFAFVSALVGMVRALYVHNLFVDDFLTTFVETLLQMALPFVGYGILLFAANFPTPFLRPRRLHMALALIAALALSAIAVIARLPALPQETQALLADINYFGVLVLYFIGLFVLTARFVWRLIIRRRLNWRERRVLIIVVVGLAAAMPMLVVSGLTWLPANWGMDYYFRGLDIRYLLLFVPLAFAYALVRYRSLVPPSRLFLLVILLSFSAIVAALGAWAWTGARPGWPESGADPPFIALFFVTLLSCTLWGAGVSSGGLFGRFLHYDRRAYDEVRAFGRLIPVGAADLNELPADIVQSLIQGLKLERAAVWRRRNSDGRLALASRAGEFHDAPAPELVIPAEMDGRERDRLLTGLPLRLERPDLAPDWLRPVAGPSFFELAVPLVGEEGLEGLLAFGPRRDEGIFDDRDMAVAELVGRLVTLYFTVAAGMVELRRAPGRMAEVQDRERQRLAQELHDTIQQLLGRLPFYLSFSRDALQAQPEKVREILELCIGDVEEAAAVVRHIRHNLAPSELERGLAGAVAALCRRFERRTAVITTCRLDPAVDGHTTLETRFAIYRVIQQALDNVAAHAAASAVVVTMDVAGDAIHFTIRDDGRGSSEAERRLSRERGSFGLQSMRARVEADGGHFTFDSGPDGTTVGGQMPIRPAEA